MNHQSRQFKTANPRPFKENSSTSIKQPAINYLNQHSQLQWLETVVYDMKRYRGGNSDSIKKLNSTRQKDDFLRKVLHPRQIQNRLQGSKKIKNSCEKQCSKTKKLIKFEVYSKKGRKDSWAKSQSQEKQKIKKQFQQQLKYQERNIKKQIQVNKIAGSFQKEEKDQTNNIYPCYTDILARSFETLEEDNTILSEKSSSLKKNVGKIIKNKKERFESCFSQIIIKKQDSIKSQSKVIPKVFIKLETENLSKYLQDSEVKTDKEIYNMEQSTINMIHQSKKQNKDKEKEYVIRKQSQCTSVLLKLDESQMQHENQIYFVKDSIHSKSLLNQQRRFNKNVSFCENSISEVKYNQEIMPDKQNLIRVFEDNCKDNNLSCDKLFTVQQQIHESNKINVFHESPSKMQDSSVFEPLSLDKDSSLRLEVKITNPQLIHQRVEVTTSIFQNKSEQKDKQKVNKPIFAQQNYQQQLIILFKFLDQGKKGLLSPSNCRTESLPQELKLLFSAIFHQIKTKKRLFDLQTFIKVATQVLIVKQEIYRSQSSRENPQLIRDTLRSNLVFLNQETLLKTQKPQRLSKLSQFEKQHGKYMIHRSDRVQEALRTIKERSKQVSYFQKPQNFSYFEQKNHFDQSEPEIFYQNKYKITLEESQAQKKKIQMLFSLKDHLSDDMERS